MHWILQENIYQEEKWNELVHHLERMNISHSIHKVVPFSGELIPDIELNEKVWAMGSLSMGRTCRQKGWLPGVIELPDFKIQRHNWGDKLFNYDAGIWDIEFLKYAKLPDFYPEECFIRPIDDSKLIKGQIMTKEEIHQWARDLQQHEIEIATEFLIAPPKKIQCEARFWMVDGEVVTYSLYKLGSTIVYNRKLVDQDMIWFANGMGTHPMIIPKVWQPAKAYCLDLCRTEDNQIKIVEINSINSSGLYDCDVQKLVVAIKGAFR